MNTQRSFRIGLSFLPLLLVLVAVARGGESPQKFRARLDSANRFAHGKATMRGATDFAWLVRQTYVSSGFSALFRERVPALSSSKFRGCEDSVLNKWVNEDNRRLRLDSFQPTALSVKSDLLEALIEKTQAKWNNLVDEILLGDGPASVEIESFLDCVGDMEEEMQRLASGESEAMSSGFIKARRSQLRGLRRMVSQLSNEEYATRLRDHLYGCRFSGGTVKQLCEFMVEKRVSLRPGTEVHDKVLVLCDQMVAQSAQRNGLGLTSRSASSPTARYAGR